MKITWFHIWYRLRLNIRIKIQFPLPIRNSGWYFIKSGWIIIQNMVWRSKFTHLLYRSIRYWTNYIVFTYKQISLSVYQDHIYGKRQIYRKQKCHLSIDSVWLVSKSSVNWALYIDIELYNISEGFSTLFSHWATRWDLFKTPYKYTEPKNQVNELYT